MRETPYAQPDRLIAGLRYPVESQGCPIAKRPLGGLAPLLWTGMMLGPFSRHVRPGRDAREARRPTYHLSRRALIHRPSHGASIVLMFSVHQP